MNSVRILRVFIAGPGDVQRERDLAVDVIADINRSIAADRAVRLEPVAWETDAYPGFDTSGPQGLIDAVLCSEDCDLLIGIFWKRFGTPTAQGQSGTEHEFRRAYERWKAHGRPQLMMYFSQLPYTPESRAETDQWGAVLEFRRNFPSEGLWWVYETPEAFGLLLRRHLTNFIRHTYPLAKREPTHQQTADLPTAESLFEDVQRELIASHEGLFVGRNEVFGALKNFMTTQPNGYFIVRAGPGQGKTALACQLLKRHRSIYHFITRNAARADSRQIMSSMLAQMQRLGESLPKFPYIPPVRQYFDALAHIAAASPTVLVIDALDELRVDIDELDVAYLLPDPLPVGLYVVVTSRPCTNLDRLQQELFNRPCHIHELHGLTMNEVGDVLGRLIAGISQEDIERIAGASQGNPLYLRAIVEEFRANPLYDIRRLPQNVEGFFRRSVASLRLGNATLAAVLGALAVSRTPLSVGELSEITGIPQRTVYDQGIQPVAQFLLCSNDRYRFYHLRFHDFVVRKVLYEDELREAHRAMADWLSQPEKIRSTYRFSSVTYHLYESGDRPRLLQLIDKEFLAEKTQRLRYAVLEDLELIARSLLLSSDPAALDRCMELVEAVMNTGLYEAWSDVGRSLQPWRSEASSFRPHVIEPSVPAVPGYDVYIGILPKGTASADFAEVVATDTRLWVAIGDAPSVGLQSAFVARFVANLFRTLVDRTPSRGVAAVISTMDDMLGERLEFQRVSMQCISIDAARGVATLASAGHPFPVHYCARRGKCDILPIRGELLQPVAGAATLEHDDYMLDIAPGDLIVMVTDGLTEAHVRKGNPYGYAFTRVVEEHAGAGARVIGDTILRDWRRHERMADLGDDTTVVVIRIAESPARGPAM